MPSAFYRFLKAAKSEKLFTFANVSFMTATFLVLGLFFIVQVFSQTFLDSLEKEASITIFFKDDFDEPKILDLKFKIENDPRVFNVNYVSKEDALKIFKELNKDEPLLLESVTASVLPASLEIRAKDSKDLDTLYEEYLNLDGVEDIKYFKDIVSKFNFWRNVLSVGVLVLLVILLIMSFAVVVSTIRTAISVRGEEYEILKLVGASDGYIKRPLVYQGAFYGAFSGFLASLIYTILFIVFYFKGWVDVLGIGNLIIFSNYSVPLFMFVPILGFILVISGLLLGFVSSNSAVSKYLKY